MSASRAPERRIARAHHARARRASRVSRSAALDRRPVLLLVIERCSRVLMLASWASLNSTPLSFLAFGGRVLAPARASACRGDLGVGAWSRRALHQPWRQPWHRPWAPARSGCAAASGAATLGCGAICAAAAGPPRPALRIGRTRVETGRRTTGFDSALASEKLADWTGACASALGAAPVVSAVVIHPIGGEAQRHDVRRAKSRWIGPERCPNPRPRRGDPQNSHHRETRKHIVLLVPLLRPLPYCHDVLHPICVGHCPRKRCLIMT